MKPTLYVTFGIPGSGKSTWSRAMIKQNENPTVRISMDGLRNMLNPKDCSDKYSNLLQSIYYSAISRSLGKGYDVIADSTNLYALQDLYQISRKYGTSFSIVRFDEVDLQTCLNRNQKRSKEDRVDEAILHSMHAELDKVKLPVEKLLEEYSYQ